MQQFRATCLHRLLVHGVTLRVLLHLMFLQEHLVTNPTAVPPVTRVSSYVVLQPTRLSELPAAYIARVQVFGCVGTQVKFQSSRARQASTADVARKPASRRMLQRVLAQMCRHGKTSLTHLAGKRPLTCMSSHVNGESREVDELLGADHTGVRQVAGVAQQVFLEFTVFLERALAHPAGERTLTCMSSHVTRHLRPEEEFLVADATRKRTRCSVLCVIDINVFVCNITTTTIRMCSESINLGQGVSPQPKVIHDSNPDFQVNPDSDPDVFWIASKVIRDSNPDFQVNPDSDPGVFQIASKCCEFITCRRQSFRRVS